MTRAFTFFALTLATNAVASTHTVAGMDIDADWSGSGSTWTASGRVDIGAVDVHVHSMTATATSLSAEVEHMRLRLSDGCDLNIEGGASLGLSMGDDILDVVPDAPVLADERYLHVDVGGEAMLRCMELSVPLGDTSTRIYVNPDDPSVYFHASELEGELDHVVGPSLGAVTLGASREGLIPWTSPWNDAHGNPRYVDAHLVVGGDFEFNAGQYRIGVEQGEQAIRLNGPRVEEVCASGRIYMPGLRLADGMTIDLPLGQGVTCYRHGRFEISALVGANEWSEFGLDPFLTSILDELASVGDLTNRLRVEGSLDMHGRGRLSFGNEPAEFGFSNGLSGVDGTLTLDTHSFTPKLQVEGSVDYGVGPFSFANASATIELGGRGIGNARIRGDASIPGTGGRDVEVDLHMDPRGAFSGSAEANLWGARVNGSFRGYRTTLYSSTLSTGIRLRPFASGKLKMELDNNDVDVKAKACSLGVCRTVGVSSSGCLRIFSTNICI